VLERELVERLEGHAAGGGRRRVERLGPQVGE